MKSVSYVLSFIPFTTIMIVFGKCRYLIMSNAYVIKNYIIFYIITVPCNFINFDNLNKS